MFATLEAKLIAAGVSVLLAGLLALGAYAGYQHIQAQNARIDTLSTQVKTEQANTAAALVAASAVSAALDARATAQNVAQTRSDNSTKALAQAVAADPAVASMVVPESYWQAIYGGPSDDTKK
jgi:hypothetical protein